MAITAPHREQERKGAEREAWRAYSESLRDLDGRDYEDAERTSWEALQGRLRDIARQYSPQG